MKIRTDFVTNSSSSSFIVCFDKSVKKTYASVKAAMFPHYPDEQIIEQYDNMDTVKNIVSQVVSDMKKVTQKELLEQLESWVYHMNYELNECRKNNRNNMMIQLIVNPTYGQIDEMVKGLITEKEIYHPDADELFKERYGKDFYKDIVHNKSVSEADRKKFRDIRNKIYSECDKHYCKVAKKLADRIMKKYGTLYIFHYGDEDGSFGCLLEHGGIFRNVDHLRISHH